MSPFKKILASVGIGAARVDTQLYEAVAIPGGTLEGEVRVIGGDIAQDIEQIYLYVAIKYKRESEDSTYYEECKLLKHQVSQGFTIQPQEEKIISVSFKIPYQTPLTLGEQEVYIRTGLDIAMAINPKDWDYISIQPHPLMQAVLNALELLGFRLYKSDCEYNVRLGRDYPFVQELEFRPTEKYQKQLDELEVIFYLESNQLEVLLEIDRRARGLTSWVEEALDTDESYARLYVSSLDLNQPLQNLTSKIENLLQRHTR
ncbi:MAG: sporulation protein [Hydrococcus sp. Prado102]|jgi:sporulation-control protein|nr:sporulation protein [Hydrococcus sp. Prado102]